MEVPVSRKPREAANLPSTGAMDSLSTIHAGAGRLVRAGMVPVSWKFKQRFVKAAVSRTQIGK